MEYRKKGMGVGLVERAGQRGSTHRSYTRNVGLMVVQALFVDSTAPRPATAPRHATPRTKLTAIPWQARQARRSGAPVCSPGQLDREVASQGTMGQPRGNTPHQPPAVRDPPPVTTKTHHHGTQDRGGRRLRTAWGR